MSSTQPLSVSPYLTAERDRLLQQILDVGNAGRIAPAYYWLKEESQTKGNVTYSYIRLVCEPPEKKATSKSVGKPGSAKHHDWEKAIARRDAIAELEQQLQRVEAIIDRQIATAQQVAIAPIADSD